MMLKDGRPYMEEREYYPLGEIKYTARQCLWLLRHLLTLKVGDYPPDPAGAGSGYTEFRGGKRPTKHRASFETPALVAAELEVRLSKCGLDGLILRDLIMLGDPPEYLARCLGMSQEMINRRSMRALKYISSEKRGWKRRRISYQEFVGHRKSQN